MYISFEKGKESSPYLGWTSMGYELRDYLKRKVSCLSLVIWHEIIVNRQIIGNILFIIIIILCFKSDIIRGH